MHVELLTQNLLCRLARKRLAAGEQLIRSHAVRENIDAMIDAHHRIRTLPAGTQASVEAFRRADWIDVSRGVTRLLGGPMTAQAGVPAAPAIQAIASSTSEVLENTGPKR